MVFSVFERLFCVKCSSSGSKLAGGFGLICLVIFRIWTALIPAIVSFFIHFTATIASQNPGMPTASSISCQLIPKIHSFWWASASTASTQSKKMAPRASVVGLFSDITNDLSSGSSSR